MKATKLMALGLVSLTTLGLAATANAEDTNSQQTTEASITFGNYVDIPEVEGPDGGTYPPESQNPGAVQNNGWQLIAPKQIIFTNNPDGTSVTTPTAGNTYYALKEAVVGTEKNAYVPLSLKLVYDSDQDHSTGQKVTSGSITATRTALQSSATKQPVKGIIGIDNVAVNSKEGNNPLITKASIEGEDKVIPEVAKGGTETPLKITFEASEPDSGAAQGLIFLANDAKPEDKQSVTEEGIYIQLESALKNTKVTSTITWTLNTGEVTGE